MNTFQTIAIVPPTSSGSEPAPGQFDVEIGRGQTSVVEQAYPTSAPFVVIALQPLASQTFRPWCYYMVDMHPPSLPPPPDPLARLRGLAPNWDGYGAPPPNDHSIRIIEDVLTLAHERGIAPTAIVPSGEGGSIAHFAKGSRRGDIECFNDGEVYALTASPEGEPHVWPVRADNRALADTLERIRDFIEG